MNSTFFILDQGVGCDDGQGWSMEKTHRDARLCRIGRTLLRFVDLVALC